MAPTTVDPSGPEGSVEDSWELCGTWWSRMLGSGFLLNSQDKSAVKVGNEGLEGVMVALLRAKFESLTWYFIRAMAIVGRRSVF